MTKYNSEDIRKIAERLKSARDRDRPAHFLVGAGCSISAGIPGATDLIKRIHKDYPAHCEDLSSTNRDSYGACMALLSLNERRDLIKPYLENAKINWGTIALAQLIVNNFIGRVLTANFDLVLENACGLLGLQPAVYDFGVAPANDPEMIVSPSIIHLHGQSYGLVLLNTDEETNKHREKLRPILTDSLRNAPLVVVGYSGSADGIFQTLFDEFEGRERLYWASYEEEPMPHIRPFLEKNHFQFIGGADFDRFMIELARSLGYWPPNLFANPLGHLLDGLRPVVSYPLMDSENAIDLLADLRRKLESWRKKLIAGESPTGTLQKFFMKGQFEEAVEEFSSRMDRSSISDEDKDIAAWSFIMLGNLLSEQAQRASGEEAARLFAAAAEKYQAALTVKPDKHEALNNWGNLLSAQAQQASGEEAARLFTAAAEKYQAALTIKPDSHEALDNWGSLLLERAKHATGADVMPLLVEAGEKLAAAAKIDPANTYNLACLAALLGDETKCRHNLENAERYGTLPDAEHLTADTDLDAVRDKPWFQELLRRQKKNG
jgi:tetratricopeptide (TPR) repeat protein